MNHHDEPSLAVRQRATPAERAAKNPTSMRLAIWAMCYACQDTGEPTPHVIKAAVRDCVMNTCPLWPHRGWQDTTTRRRRQPCQIEPQSNA
jgi:hypothetical protein